VGRVSSAIWSLRVGSIVTGSASTRAISSEGAAVSPSGATPRSVEKRVVTSWRTIRGAAKVSDRGLGSVFLKRNGCSLQREGLLDGSSRLMTPMPAPHKSEFAPASMVLGVRVTSLAAEVAQTPLSMISEAELDVAGGSRIFRLHES
jgi:hypothetical protein